MPRRMRTSRLSGAARAARRRRSRSTPPKESSRSKPTSWRTRDGVVEQAVDLGGAGRRLGGGDRGGLGAAAEEELVGEDQHRLGEVERRLHRRAGDGDHGARQRQLLVGQAADLGAEDEGGRGVGRILLQPGGELARREEGDAEAAVAGGGGADDPAEGGERGVQAVGARGRCRGSAGRRRRRRCRSRRSPPPARPGSAGRAPCWPSPARRSRRSPPRADGRGRRRGEAGHAEALAEEQGHGRTRTNTDRHGRLFIVRVSPCGPCSSVSVFVTGTRGAARA